MLLRDWIGPIFVLALAITGVQYLAGEFDEREKEMQWNKAWGVFRNDDGDGPDYNEYNVYFTKDGFVRVECWVNGRKVVRWFRWEIIREDAFGDM